MAPSRLLDILEPSRKYIVQTASHKSERLGLSTFKVSALFWADLLTRFALYVMINYLTNVWNLSITHAAGIINIWNGITPALAIVFTFFVDSFMGHYRMLVLSTIAYSIGLGLLFLSTPPIFGPCNEYKEECIGHIQKALFFTTLPLIAVGKAGHIVSFKYFLRLQIERELAEGGGGDGSGGGGGGGGGGEGEGEGGGGGGDGGGGEGGSRGGGGGGGGAVDVVVDVVVVVVLAGVVAGAGFGVGARAVVGVVAVAGVVAGAGAGSKLVFIIFRLIIVALALIAGLIALSYIKPWSIRFGIPAICTLIATGLFLIGSTRYHCNEPKGCPLTIGLRVFVAAASKDFQHVSNFTEIFNDDNTNSTESLRCLNKAAIKFPDQARSKSWTLCSVREVEDTKTGICMVPLWLTFIAIGLVLSVETTYFLEQANHMDLKLGTIKVPIPVFLLLHNLFSEISSKIYILLKKYFPRKYVSRIGIAIGMVLSVLCCITAAIVETQRLRVIRDHGLLNHPNERAPMSVFFLLPQFVLLAAADGIATVGINGLLMHQVPESMYSYMIYFRKFAMGLGSIGNVLLVYVVGKLSERNNNQSWFQRTSDKSRLDRYYWILAGLSTVNLIIYTIVASFYKYKSDDNESEGGEMAVD